MATVTNIRLSVEKGRTPNQRNVTVSYRITFAQCEAVAGSVFTEKVNLLGDDPLFDDIRITLLSDCVRAQAQPLDRTIQRVVSSQVTDEDADITILGVQIKLQDELFARVTLTPFEPHGATGDSNVVKGQFGKD